MPDRSSSARSTPRGVTLSIDVVLLTPSGSELAVLLALGAARTRSRDRAMLPSDALRQDEMLDDAAARIAREALGAPPSLLDQAGARGGAKRVTDAPQVSVTYFGLVPDGAGDTRAGCEWTSLSE